MGMFIYTFKLKKTIIKYHRKQFVLIPYWLGSHIIKITGFFFSRRSWKTFQSLAWGESTWRLEHGFLRTGCQIRKRTDIFVCTMIRATAYITTADALREHWGCWGLPWTWGWILPSIPIPGQHELSLSHSNSFCTCAHSFLWY